MVNKDKYIKNRITEDISKWTGMKIDEAAVAAEDRDCWGRILRAANPSYEDDDEWGGRKRHTTVSPSRCYNLISGTARRLRGPSVDRAR